MKRITEILTWTAIVLALSGGPLVAQGDPVKPELITKWSQWVDMDNGHSIVSHHNITTLLSTIVPSVAADDWRCLDGRPVTDFHWWGSYEAGSPGALGAFRLLIQADIPADDCHPSHPGELRWSGGGTMTQVEEVFFGTHADGTEVYQYNLVIDDPQDWFYPERNEIYWLSITALSFDLTTDPEDTVVWAWRTALRPTPENGLDASVRMINHNYATGEYEYWGSLYDEGCNIQMAFELSTVPEPASIALVGTAALVALGVVRRRKLN